MTQVNVRIFLPTENSRRDVYAAIITGVLDVFPVCHILPLLVVCFSTLDPDALAATFHAIEIGKQKNLNQIQYTYHVL